MNLDTDQKAQSKLFNVGGSTWAGQRGRVNVDLPTKSADHPLRQASAHRLAPKNH